MSEEPIAAPAVRPPTRRERAAERRARRRRRQLGAAAAGLLVPVAVTVWGVQQPGPGPGAVAAEGTRSTVLAAASTPTAPVPPDAARGVAGSGGVLSRPGPAPVPAAPRATAPARVPTADVVTGGTGRLVAAPGGTRRAGTGPLLRYLVEVEEGLGEDVTVFAAAVDATLADPRSWGAGGRQSFQRVPPEEAEEADFRVTLASPATTDRLCAPLDTEGIYSCHNAGRAVVNAMRWADGAEAYAGDLAGYRRYVVNHEVGHALGFGHDGCRGAGQPAPVMMQQTIGVGACRPNPWPYADGG